MKIRIVYQVKNQSERFAQLTPEEYFDPLDGNENFEDDGIPKFNHAEEYLDVAIEKLEWTEIQITETKIEKNSRTQFFDKGKSWMCHIKDSSGYEEIIISSQLSNLDTHISRIHKENERWQVNLNSLITDLADGSQKEKQIF